MRKGRHKVLDVVDNGGVGLLLLLEVEILSLKCVEVVLCLC